MYEIYTDRIRNECNDRVSITSAKVFSIKFYNISDFCLNLILIHDEINSRIVV